MDLFNLQNILTNPLVGAAVIGGLFYSLKEYPKKVFSFVQKKISERFIYTVRIPEYDDLFEIFERWLYVNHPTRYRNVQANISYRCNYEPTDINVEARKSKKVPPIFYRQAPTLFYLKRNGKTIFIDKQEEKIEHATSLSTMYGYKYVLRGFRCREEINGLLNEIIHDHFTALGKNTIRVRPNDEWGTWQTGNDLTVKALENIIIPAAVKTGIKEDIDQFLRSKQWYQDRGIPYKRAFCFHGRPGTGKTSLALGIAAYTGRDIYMLNLSALRNDAAMQVAFSNIGPNAVLVLEDIDAAFLNRESKSGNISFSCLLNCTDGALYKEGVIMVVTTNHIEKIDPALLREGRMDMVVKIDYPGIPEIEEYLSIFYGERVLLNCDCDNLLLPMAAVQEACIANRNDKHAAINRINSLLLKKETV